MNDRFHFDFSLALVKHFLLTGCCDFFGFNQLKSAVLARLLLIMLDELNYSSNVCHLQESYQMP